MTTPGAQILQSARLSAVMAALEDPRLRQPSLIMSARVPQVDSYDGEILARDNARVLVADIIADDSQAATYSTGKMTFESFNIPNLKIGIHFTQDQINQLVNLGLAGGVPGSQLYPGTGESIVNAVLRNRLQMLELGIQQRQEALTISMMLDSLTYDRMGIKLVTTWGTPSDLKTALIGTATWDAAATADGVGDILSKKLYAKVRWGENYNRVTMSTTAFQYLIAQTTFQNRARAILVRYGATGLAPIPTQDLTQMQTLFENMTQCSLELHDGRYWEPAKDGTYSSVNLWPIDTIMFSDRADDGVEAAMNVANSIVTESIVGQLIGQGGGLLGSIGGPRRGPVAYATGSLDPPNIQLWAVKRCFPRKVRLSATATLKVGSFTDLVPVGEPF